MCLVKFYQRPAQVKTTKLQILQDIKNHGLPPPIELLKVHIKTHTEENYIDNIFLYVMILNTGLDEALFKFLILLNKTLKGQNLNTKPHR